MSTDIEPYRPHAAEPTPNQIASDFRSWAPKLQAASAIAREVANTEFVPGALRGNTAATTAAILAGSEMGIGPMASLMHVHVIDGRPSLSAEMARSLVLGLGHTIRYREMTTARCVVDGRRIGEQDWTTVTWTMDDAKRAGLDGRANWRRYPRRMLAARATGELCRLVFSDAMAGMPYVSEELDDDSDDVAATHTAPNGTAEAKPVRRRTPTATTRKRKASGNRGTASAGPRDEPPLPGEESTESTVDNPPSTVDNSAESTVDNEPKPTGHDEPITRDQSTKLATIFTNNQVGDRDRRLGLSSYLIGRQLSSSNDLTKAEASQLIDALEALGSTGQDLEAAIDEMVAADEANALEQAREREAADAARAGNDDTEEDQS